MTHIIKLQIFLLAILSFSLVGCCSMPLIDCGPTIEKIEIIPRDTTFFIENKNLILNFKGFNYYDRKNKNIILTNINIELENEVKDEYEFIFNKNDIYYFYDERKIYSNEINEFTNGYSISFSNGLQSNQINVKFILKKNDLVKEININLIIKDKIF